MQSPLGLLDPLPIFDTLTDSTWTGLLVPGRLQASEHIERSPDRHPLTFDALV